MFVLQVLAIKYSVVRVIMLGVTAARQQIFNRAQVCLLQPHWGMSKEGYKCVTVLALQWCIALSRPQLKCV